MENSAAAASAPAEWSPFLFLLLAACGTLVAALLVAAHRLGLFYQLMHKVPGHWWEAGWGGAREGGF